MTEKEISFVCYVFEYVYDEKFLGEESLALVKSILDKYRGVGCASAPLSLEDFKEN